MDEPGVVAAAEGFWARRVADMLVMSTPGALRGREELERLLRRFDRLEAGEYTFTYVDEHGWFRVSLRAGGDETAELRADRRSRPWKLSPKELDVLTLIACGLTNQQIARRLALSESTVGTHVEHLLAKAGQRARGALAALAAEGGLLRFPLPGGVTAGLAELGVVRLTALIAGAPTGRVAPKRRRRRAFRVGAVYPDSPVGDDMLRGARLAVERLNARGGVAGEPIELVSAMARDGDDALDRFVRLVDEGAAALSAVHLDGAVDSLAAFARDIDLPFLHAFGTGSAMRSPLRPHETANVFQLCPGTDVYLPELSRFLRAHSDADRVCRIVVLSAAPDTADVPRPGRDRVTYDSLAASSPGELADAVVSLRLDPPDAVLVHAYDEPSLRRMLDVLFAGAVPALVFALWTPGTYGFPAARYEGLCWLSDVGGYDDPVYTRFRRSFAARFGVNPGSDASVQYDAIALVARAWRAVGRATSPRRVAEEITATAHRGVNGAFYLDNQGHAVFSVPRDTADTSLGQRTVIRQVQDGVGREIWPPATARGTVRRPAVA